MGCGNDAGVKVVGSFTIEEMRGLRLLYSESDEDDEDEDGDLDLDRESSDDSADELPVKERRERRDRRGCAVSSRVRPLRRFCCGDWGAGAGCGWVALGGCDCSR